MRRAVRAIVIKNNHILVMHRNKFGREFYALVGGGIDYGENQMQALERELSEEASLIVTNPKLVIVEDAGDVFGVQYIYTCDWVSGEPALSPTSEEALIHESGKNLYTPMWLPLSDLAETKLLPSELHQLLVQHAAAKSWPAEPIELTIAS
jgi:ADP-ribose pyrophosphatase YjhB (NUDIX family)